MDARTAFDKTFDKSFEKESEKISKMISAQIDKGCFNCVIFEPQWMPENIRNNIKEELMTKYLEKIGYIGMKAKYFLHGGVYEISWKLGPDEIMAKFDAKIDTENDTKVDAENDTEGETKIAEIAKQTCDVLELENPEREKPRDLKSAYQFYKDEIIDKKSDEFCLQYFMKWRNMSFAQKEKYRRMEEEDKIRYEREMAEYEKNSQ